MCSHMGTSLAQGTLCRCPFPALVYLKESGLWGLQTHRGYLQTFPQLFTDGQPEPLSPQATLILATKTNLRKKENSASKLVVCFPRCQTPSLADSQHCRRGLSKSWSSQLEEVPLTSGLLLEFLTQRNPHLVSKTLI